MGTSQYTVVAGELLTYICRPGRIHHCMRSIGAAQYALDLLLQRVTDPAKKTFGKFLYEHGRSLLSFPSFHS